MSRLQSSTEPVLSENWIVLSQHGLGLPDNRGMTFDFFRLQLLLAAFAGWVQRDQSRVIAYLVEENRVPPLPMPEVARSHD